MKRQRRGPHYHQRRRKSYYCHKLMREGRKTGTCPSANWQGLYYFLHLPRTWPHRHCWTQTEVAPVANRRRQPSSYSDLFDCFRHHHHRHQGCELESFHCVFDCGNLSAFVSIRCLVLLRLFRLLRYHLLQLALTIVPRIQYQVVDSWTSSWDCPKLPQLLSSRMQCL